MKKNPLEEQWPVGTRVRIVNAGSFTGRWGTVRRVGVSMVFVLLDNAGNERSFWPNELSKGGCACSQAKDCEDKGDCGSGQCGSKNGCDFPFVLGNAEDLDGWIDDDDADQDTLPEKVIIDALKKALEEEGS